MNILITNDDGIYADGIKALAKEISSKSSHFNDLTMMPRRTKVDTVCQLFLLVLQDKYINLDYRISNKFKTIIIIIIIVLNLLLIENNCLFL